MEKAPSSKRPCYDAVFRAETLRLASGSRSALAAARALNINAKLLYQWQKAAQQPLPAGGRRGTALRAQVRRQVQELAMLKKAVSSHSPRLREHASVL